MVHEGQVVGEGGVDGAPPTEGQPLVVAVAAAVHDCRCCGHVQKHVLEGCGWKEDGIISLLSLKFKMLSACHGRHFFDDWLTEGFVGKW